MRRLIRTLLIFAPGFLAQAACGGADKPTAPPLPPPLTVTFSSALSVSTGAVVPLNGAPAYQCSFPVTVTAVNGRSGEYAYFDGGEIDWKLSANGQTFVSTLFSSNMQDRLGADRIHPGEVINHSFSLSWTGPFTAAFIFRYTLRTDSTFGEGRSATLFFVCQ